MYVCFFDIDGTLLSTGGAGKHAMESALCEEFGLAGIRHQVPYSGRTDRAIARDLLEGHGIADTPEVWERFRTAYLQRLPTSLRMHRGSVLPGVEAFLRTLARCPFVAVGLLTGNIEAGARLKLRHYGLEHYFSFGGFGDNTLCRNEVARSALDAARQALDSRCHPERIWVIGDTPLDVDCARAIGARVAVVCTGTHTREQLSPCQPDLLFDNLTEYPRLLARLQQD
ncbi:MAG: haloacid dehalogenase [Gemmataceae bacterium]